MHKFGHHEDEGEGTIPSFETEEEAFEWANSPEGSAVLEAELKLAYDQGVYAFTNEELFS
jgi:hypothetical protein